MMMTNKSDPLSVLLEIRSKMATKVDEELISACYKLQSERQYDKDRNTMQQMQGLVETVILSNEGDVLL